MNDMIKKRHIYLLLSGLVITVGVIFHFSFKSEKVLFLIAEGLDRPSSFHNTIMKRIYHLSENQNFIDKIKRRIEQGDNVHLHDLYIQTLGIAGDSSSGGVLIKEYSRWQHDMNQLSKINRIIDAMGLINSDDLIPFLEKLLEDHDRLKVQATKYSIARSLYLLTGKKYPYVNHFGQETKFQVTKEIAEARNVIVASKERSRNLQEMVLLDKLYQPPE